MKTMDILYYAFGAITSRKIRTILTSLGISIGVGATIALMSLGQGFQQTLNTKFEQGFATNTLVITNQALEIGSVQKDFKLFINDIKVLTQSFIKKLTPIIQKSCILRYNSTEKTLLLYGVDYNNYSLIFQNTFKSKSGEINESLSNSVVIGSRIAEEFKIHESENQTLNLIWTIRSGVNFYNKTMDLSLISILDSIGGSTIGGPNDNGVYIPLETAQAFFETDECESILIQLFESDAEKVDEVSNIIEKLFDNKVYVVSPKSFLSAISSIVDSIESFNGAITGISLIVAGVGIMNIMLISVLERTREIGIMKAQGAKKNDILKIFLCESSILGLFGSTLGIGLGYIIAIVANSFNIFGEMISRTDTTVIGEIYITPSIDPIYILEVFFFSIFISLIFGIYPALRASKLNPVEALKYE